MEISEENVELADADLQEIFGLFTSCTEYERLQVYDPDGFHYFPREDLDEEYELTNEKREFALDAVRSVLYFLHRSGYRLEKDGRTFGLQGVRAHFV